MTPIDWTFVDTLTEATPLDVAKLTELRDALLDLEETAFNHRTHDDHWFAPRKLTGGCADCVARVKQDQRIAAIPDMSQDDLIDEWIDGPFADIEAGGPHNREDQALAGAMREHGLDDYLEVEDDTAPDEPAKPHLTAVPDGAA